MNFKSFTLLFLVLLLSCNSYKHASPRDANDLYAPPGTVIIAPNLYYDQTELSNISWKEYQYWTEHVYGINSQQFLATMPDTTVWENASRLKEMYKGNEFNHPAYNYYPVVGLSLTQIKNYTEWRTNRVIESILINDDIWVIPEKVDSNNCFKADMFFSKLENDNNLRKILIPVYSLPSLLDYTQAVKYSESDNCNKKQQNEEAEFANKWKTKTVSIDDISSSHSFKSYSKNCKCIYFLQSNVNEYLTDTIIGNLPEAFDSLTIISPYDPTINAWTGFRNTCKWVTVEDYLKQ